MKCVIEGNNVKVFGRALHALSRIGQELWLDPLEKGLALRAVNSAQSAYACFLFSPLFFHQYMQGVADLPSSHLKCKLTMKSVLPLFRCLATIERNVKKFQISVSLPDSRVIFQFFCRHGITKTHYLAFQECEPLQALFPAHLCPNVLKAQARLLGDIVMHFPVCQEEVTLTLSSMRVNVKNFYEEDQELMKAMHTEMSLTPAEFDYFQAGVDSDITFCLKELRGLLSFAESYSLPVAIHFGLPGKPISFSVVDMVLEASVVLATLADLESRTPSQASGPREEEARAAVTPGCRGEADSHSPAAAQPPVQGGITPSMGPGEQPPVQGGIAPSLGPGEQPPVQGDTAPSVGPAAQPPVQADITPSVGPAAQPPVQGDTAPSVCLAEPLVASSQCSPVFSGPARMRDLLGLRSGAHGNDGGEVRGHDELGSQELPWTTPVPPASLKFRSLFFAAVSGQLGDGGAPPVPSLACCSDSEEEGHSAGRDPDPAGRREI